MSVEQDCPFAVGQFLVYRPSRRGLDSEVMAAPEQKLQPGATYRVEQIVEGQYIVPEGYSHPGGGLHWSEFAVE